MALAIGMSRRGVRTQVEARAARCNACNKWRQIPDEGAYETVRAEAAQSPFTCERAGEWGRDLVCAEEEDLSPGADGRLVWALEKAGIPVTPDNWRRKVELRAPGGRRFADVFYLPPPPPPDHRRKLRSPIDVGAFLTMNPTVDRVGKDQFSFKAPTPFPPPGRN